ncbi:MAG TPA: MauE/DoxX family redox-associated membrane protein [Ignavibacteriaceae bacterium]|nr:MauE/DoxX family redox-associated membrane protein [Ignavibacteriaceae bacterium]
MDNINRNKSKIYITTIILRVLFGLLLTFSAYTKLVDIPEFQQAIMKFAIIPDSYTLIASYTIPIMELILGLLIIFNFYVILSLQVAIYLLTLFTSVIIVKLLEGGEEVSCGCFGTLSSDKIDIYTVLRNVILLSCALFIIYFKIKEKTNIQSVQSFKNKFITNLMTACVIFLISSNAALAIRNFELKSRLYMLIEDNTLNKGDMVNPFMVTKLDGTTDTINYCDFDKTIIFIIKYGCKTCIHNTIIWNEIFERFNCNNIIILGVSIDNELTTKKLIEEYKPKFPVVYNSTGAFNENFKLFQLPVTIVINPEGKIENIWKGIIHPSLIELLNKKLIITQKEGMKL